MAGLKLTRAGVCIALMMCAFARLSPQAGARVLTGTVRDTLGQPIAGANVLLADFYTAVSTDARGAFRLPIPAGEVRVRIRKLGYRLHELTVSATDGDPSGIAVVLSRAAVQLNGLTVIDSASATSHARVTRATARHLPPLGEPDPLRVLSFIGGISQPNDAAARYHLAGSSGDETLITLDGHPIQLSTHFGGTLGAFNLAAIEQGEVLMHHVTAATETRVGGIVRFESREAADRDREAVVSLVSASATIVEPDLPGGADLLVSARRTYIETLMGRIATSTSSGAGSVPEFDDLLVRLGATVRGSWRVEGLAYAARDRYAANEQSASRPLVTEEHVIGGRAIWRGASRAFAVRASTSIAQSADRTLVTFGEVAQDLSQAWISIDARFDQRISSSTRLAVFAGTDARDHEYRWNTTSGGHDDLPSRFNRAEELSVHHIGASASFARDSGRTLEVGARAQFTSNGAWVAPRAAYRRPLGARSRGELSLGRYYQFDAQFAPPQLRPQMPATFLFAKPRRMDALAATFETLPRTGARWPVRVSTSVFARQFADRPSLLATSPDTGLQSAIATEAVSARSYGGSIAATATGNRGGVLQATYSYVRAFERRDSWNRASWDVPHTLAMFAHLPIRGDLSLLISGQVHSGPTITPVESRLFTASSSSTRLVPRVLYGEPNSARLDDYARVDVGLRRTWRPRRMEVVGSLQLLNVLSRKNVLEYELLYVVQNPDQFAGAVRRSSVPMLPSIGVEIRW
jgi:hypothetical protein